MRQWLCKQRAQLCSFIHTYSKKNREEERRREREEIRRDEKRDQNNCRMCCALDIQNGGGVRGTVNGNVAEHDYRHDSL